MRLIVVAGLAFVCGLVLAVVLCAGDWSRMQAKLAKCEREKTHWMDYATELSKGRDGE